MPSLSLRSSRTLRVAGALALAIAASALIALPTVFLVAWLYSAWSTKKSVLLSIAVTLVGLAGVLWLALTAGASPVLPVALLIIGSNGIIAMLLPYAAESFPLRIRGRATGLIAACSKLGGVLAQLLSIMAIMPAAGTDSRNRNVWCSTPRSSGRCSLCSGRSPAATALGASAWKATAPQTRQVKMAMA